MEKIFTVNLPDIGEGVVEGEVVEWLQDVGASLSQDQPVVVVMTDKATVELPAPHPGTLARQYYKAGEVAHLGKPLYDIAIEGKAEKESLPEPVPVVERKIERTQENLKASRPLGGKALATPPVRKLAKAMGIDLGKVSGSGKGGRVTALDLRGSAQSTKPLQLEDDVATPLHGIRGLMAKKMAESKRTIPHFSYFEKVDAHRLMQLRMNIKRKGAQEGIRVTFMPFFIRALSRTILQFPEINSSFDQDSNSLIIHKQHNIGVAMSTTNGLIVAVLKGVQTLTMEELIRAYESLKAKAEGNALSPQDMKECTITISNYGVFGGRGLWATPIINPPQVAILALNKIQKQPFVKDDQIAIQETLDLSWSFDHRVIDGDLASRVSSHYASLIQNPAKLL